MYLLCSDLEGVFVPEIWINVAEKTGIEELRLTTRDISDYDELMKHRLGVVDKYNLTLKDITDVIATMSPLEGARECLDGFRSRVPVIILSDTYTQFAGPLMAQLGWPTLFCNTLNVDAEGKLTGYTLRQKDGKRQSVMALKGLNYTVIAMGDSYNDISMLREADHGILFRPPKNVVEEYPQFPVCREYSALQTTIGEILDAGEATP